MPSLAAATKNNGVATLQNDRFLKPVVDATLRESTIPYVGFAEPKSSRFADIKAAIPGIAEGSPYLFLPDKGYVRLDPCKFHLVEGKQFFVKYGPDGKTPEAVTTDDPGSFSSPFKEDIVAAVLVHTAEGLIPAMCSFRTTKAPAAHKALKALKQAATPEWGTQSPDHKASLGVPVPFGRFTVTVTTRPRTGKSSGQRYVGADGEVKPASLGDIRALQAAMNTDDFRNAFNTIIDAYDNKIKSLEAVAAKGVAK